MLSHCERLPSSPKKKEGRKYWKLHLNGAFSLIVDGPQQKQQSQLRKKGENYVYLALAWICCAYAAYDAVRDNIIKWGNGNLLI